MAAKNPSPAIDPIEGDTMTAPDPKKPPRSVILPLDTLKNQLAVLTRACQPDVDRVERAKVALEAAKAELADAEAQVKANAVTLKKFQDAITMLSA